MAPADPPRPKPPAGVYVQLYRHATPGRTPAAKRAQLTRYLDQIAAWAAHGVVRGVVFHGFPRELVGAWESLARLAHTRGLLALASWGLDSAKDNDGTRLSAREKGQLVGRVLADASCAAGLLDAEGQWDTTKGADDDMNDAGALALGEALRAEAPDAWVGDQPWYAIEAHGDLRRPAKPLGEGGVFRGFPVDEFARVTNWGRFRQAYIYRDQGVEDTDTFPRMDTEWSNVTPALRAAGLDRPLYVTLQGYGWRLSRLVYRLLERCLLPEHPLVIWSDPFPDDITARALAAVAHLCARGYVQPGRDPVAVVKALQADAGVDVDGVYGALTEAAVTGRRAPSG